MRLFMIMFGLGCLGLALLPSAMVMPASLFENAGDSLATGLLLLRALLAVTGLYLLAVTRFGVLDSTDIPLNFDRAPRHATLVLLGILVAAAALRAISLGTGLWYDEMLTHLAYMQLEPLQVLTTFEDANNHVLYSFLARLSIGAFGDTSEALRLPAVLFGVGGVAAIYTFSRRVMSWPEALLAAGLLAVSYHHVWFSQNARGYTALLFFSLVSSTFLIDALRSGQSWRYLAYAATAALGAYTHLTIGFLFIGQFAYVVGVSLFARDPDVFAPKPFLNALMFGFVPLGLFILTLYAVILPDILGGALLTSGLQRGSEWTNPAWAIRELIGSLRAGFSGFGVLLLGGVVVLIGMADFARRQLAPVVFLVVPCGLAALFMASIGYTLFPRFFFFAAGFGVVILIHGGTLIGRLAGDIVTRKGVASNAIALAPALLLIALSAASLRQVYAPKQDFTGPIAFLEQEMRPGDAVAVVGVAKLPFIDFYGNDWTAVTTADEIEALLNASDRVWTIYSFPVIFSGAYPDIDALFRARFEIREVFYGSLGGGEVIVSASTMSGEPGS